MVHLRKSRHHPLAISPESRRVQAVWPRPQVSSLRFMLDKLKSARLLLMRQSHFRSGKSGFEPPFSLFWWMRNDLTNMVIIEDDAGTFALTWFENSIELTGKALSYLSNPNLAGHYLAPSVLIMKKIKITSNLNSHPNLFGKCPFPVL